MNRSYKVIWNKSLRCFMAVSEYAKSRGKSSSSSVSSNSVASEVLSSGAKLLRLTAICAGIAASGFSMQAIAADGNFDNINATGDIVAAGNVTAQNITALDGRVGQNETDIGTNTTNISTNTSIIADHEARITNNTTKITTNINSITDILGKLGVDTENPTTGAGVKYFRANSSLPDAEATGEDSVAIGPNAKSEGESSLVAGNGAATTEGARGAIALGQGAQAGTVSIDPNFVDGEGSIAIGRNSVTGGTSSTAVGDGAKATASNSAAMGNNAQATAGNATALGANAKASGGNSIALGNATAGSSNAFAAGNGAVANSPDSISLGTGAGVNTSGTVAADRRSQVAIGNKAGQNVTAKETIGIGFSAGSNVEGDNNMAIGTNAGTNINGEYNIAMGFEANKGAGVINHATVVGGKASAGSNSVALGYEAKANDTDSVALGNQAQAQAQGLALGSNAKAESDDVALGFNSSAGNDDFNGSSYLTSNTDGAGVVSVGNASTGLTRRIVNVADGAQGNDAVNVNQLKSAQRSVANLVGGGVLLNEDGSYGKIRLKDTGGATIEFDTIFDAVGSITDGTVNILPADTVKYNANGGISNVAAGIDSTDAVNVQQLNEKIAEKSVKYFSVNSTEGANRNNQGASGANAIAIGPQASAPGEESLALGYQARSEANTSVAIGKDVRAEGVQSTVLGNQSRVYGRKGVAIGHQAVSNGENSLVMGSGAEANEKSTGARVDNAIVIGTSAKSTASEDGIAIGRLALARENRAMAQGFTAHALADDAMAFGSNSIATGVRSTAMGTRAVASGLNAIAQGTDAAASGENASASGTKSNASGTRSIASGKDSNSYATDGLAIGTDAVSGISNPTTAQQASNANTIAIGKAASATYLDALAMGNNAQASKQNATAIGSNAKATANYAQAFGENSQASGVESIAQGRNALASAEKALAIGSAAKATAVNASAFGTGANAAAENASAFGTGATAQNEKSVAIGAGAKAQSNRSVALGDGAVAGSATGTSNATVNGLSYGGFAGTNPVATVSVGTATEKRTITNIAAGRISSTSTDAINGSQLYITNNVLGNVAKSTRNAIGGETTLNPNGTITTNNVGNTGKNNIHDAIEYAAQGWNVQTNGKEATKVAPGETVNFADGKNIKITNNGKIITVATAADVNFNTVNVDETVTIGGDTTNQTVINKGNVSTNNLTVGGVTKLGDKFTVNNDNSVTYNGQEIANKADGFSFQGNTGGAINKTLGDDQPLTISGQLAAGEASSGANLRVDSDGDKLNLVMAKDLTDLKTVTVDNTITIGSDKTNQTILNEGNVTTKDLTVSNTTKLGDTFNVTKNDVKYTGPITDGDHITNKTYVDSGRTVVKGGTNVAGVDEATDAATGKTTYTVNADGASVSGTDAVSVTKGTKGANNVTDYAVDLSQKTKDDIANANKGWDVSANGTAGENVAPGAKVDFSNTDGNILIAQNGTDLQFNLDKDLNLTADGSVKAGDSLLNNDGLTVNDGAGNITNVTAAGTTVTDGTYTSTVGSTQIVAGGANPVTINGSAGTVNGLTNTTWDPENQPIVSGQAATEDQLKSVSDVANSGWNVKTTDTNKTGISNIGPEAEVDFVSSDNNIAINHIRDTDGNTSIDFALGNDLAVGGPGKDGKDGVDGKLAVNGKDGKTGVTINGADGSIGLTGADGANGIISVTNGVPGVDGKDGITRIVIDDIEVATMKDGLKFAGNTGSTIDKQLNETLTVKGELADMANASGANLRVDSDGNNLNLVMAKDLTDLDSATFGKGNNQFTINQGGVQFVNKDGDKRDNTPSITAGGIDGGNQQITGVQSGLAGTSLEGAKGDTLLNAVNVGDLQNNITGVVNKGFNIAADNSGFADGKKIDNVKLGETVRYTSSDGNIITTIKDNEIDFGLGKDLSVGDYENPGTIVVKGENGKDGVTINGADGSIGLTGADGANGIISVTNGVAGVDGKDGITRIVVDDVEVATMKDGLKFAGNTGDTIGKQLNETLTVKGELADNANASGANLRVDSKDGHLNLVMARELTDLDSATFGKAGNRFTINQAGVQFVDATGDKRANTPSITTGGIDMGGNKITKVAAGTKDDDAVNFGQLNKVSGDVSKGLNFTGDDTTTVINRQLGQTLNITGGATGGLTNGNIGVVANGNQLEVKMAENIDLGNNGSVTMGDSVVNNDGLTIAGGPSVTKDGIDAGDKKITGVAKGDISKDSTDAVNGSQLWEVKNDIDKDVAASKTEVTEGKNITVTEAKGADGQTIYEVATSDEVAFDKVDVGSVSIDKNYVDEDGNTIIIGVGAGKADTDAVNVGQLKDVVAGANKGFNISAQGKNESNVGNGGSVDFNNTDGNIKVEKTANSNDISFNLNPNLDLGEDGSVTTGNTTVNTNGVSIKDGPSMTVDGIYAGNKTITGVADGIEVNDAVNLGQLNALDQRVSNSVNELGYKIGEVEDGANAGISAAMAMSSLPQAYIPGKSMIGGGVGTYNGQSAVAVGISRVSDNGRWVIKANGTADTQGNAGGAIGAGFHF